MDGDNQLDYNTGPDPDDDDDDDDDDQEHIIPDDHEPPPDDDLDMPGIQDSGETQEPSVPSTPFSDPDVPRSLRFNCLVKFNQYRFPV